jgi:hypothetical protein
MKKRAMGVAICRKSRFRTRFRYKFFLNVPINKTTLSKKMLFMLPLQMKILLMEKKYLVKPNIKLFLIKLFYAGLGYGLTDKLRLQLHEPINQTASVIVHAKWRLKQVKASG